MLYNNNIKERGTPTRGESMDKFQFNDLVKEVRAQFFASKYATVKQFAQYSGLWPSEFDPNRFPHWNNQKKAFLEKEISKDTALGASYQQNLKERLALTNQLMDVLQALAQEEAASAAPDIKQIENILKSMEKIVAIQDKTTQLLQIEAVREDQFNKNKTSVLDALKPHLEIKTTVTKRVKGEI